jgi:hypothetical protein
MFLSFLVVKSFIFSFTVVSVSFFKVDLESILIIFSGHEFHLFFHGSACLSLNFFEVDLGSNGCDVTSHSPSTVRSFLKLASNCMRSPILFLLKI